MGLIQNIMALKRQSTLNQQHDESFKTDQMLKNMNLSAQDIMNQMNLGQAGQKVTDGDVSEPTTSTNVPAPAPGPSVSYSSDSNGNPTQSLAPASGPSYLPATQQTVPGGPTPVGPDRQVVTYNSPSAGKQQYALNSPARNAQLADTAAERARGNKALDVQSEVGAKSQAESDAAYQTRQVDLFRRGVTLPASITDTWGLPRNMKVLPEEAQHWIEQTENLKSKGMVHIQPGATVMQMPYGALNQTSYDDNSPLGGGGGQSPAAAAPGAAGGGSNSAAPPSPNAPRVLATGGPANPTGPYAQFKYSFLPGYYQQKGITNPTPADENSAYQDFLKLKPDDAETEVALAQRAANGDPKAQAALKLMGQNKVNIQLQTAAAKDSQSGMTDDDYQREGQKYAMTGVMPSMGMQAGGRQKILHYANEFARQNGYTPKDLATIQASYAGDKDSLKKFQTQRDQIVSFENTAGKNLDNFIDLASKIPDTGSPWLNLPLRQLNKNLVGNDAMAAVDAARQVANNEIAKVTSGGGLSGVVSDSARHEIQSFNPQNATLKQTLAVAKVLKNDMANRHQAMDATLSDIKSRIGGPASGGGNQQQATHRFNPQTGKIEEIK